MKLSLTTEPSSEHLLPSGNRLVLLDVLGQAGKYPKEEQNCNIFLVDRKGTMIWRIAYHEGIRGNDPFTGIALESNGSVIGSTWDGWRFEISLSDGSLSKLDWRK